MNITKEQLIDMKFNEIIDLTKSNSLTLSDMKVLSEHDNSAIREYLADNRNCDISILNILAADKDNMVKCAVIENPNTPIKTIESILNNTDPSYAYGSLAMRDDRAHFNVDYSYVIQKLSNKTLFEHLTDNERIEFKERFYMMYSEVNDKNSEMSDYDKNKIICDYIKPNLELMKVIHEYHFGDMSND